MRIENEDDNYRFESGEETDVARKVGRVEYGLSSFLPLNVNNGLPKNLPKIVGLKIKPRKIQVVCFFN